MASPVLAPPDVKDVTLSLFAGLKTDIAPSDAPEGLSPDTQDGIYLPGEWISRPGLSRLFGTGVLTPGTSVLYEKTYVQPNDQPVTLALTSDGILWAEDFDVFGAGNVNALNEIPPGLYAQSVSAFGREYLAFSDLLHGQFIPLQYDGTFLDRVTMDGPAQKVQIADLNYPIVSISRAASTGVITVVLAVAFAARGVNLNAGFLLTISGVSGDGSLNGAFPIAGVASASGGTQTSITCWGTPGIFAISSIVRVAGVVTATLSVSLSALPANVIIAQTSDPSFAGEFAPSAISGNTVTWNQAGPDSVSANGLLYIENVSAPIVTVQNPGYLNPGSVGSVTMVGDQLITFPQGGNITITGNSVAAYNATFPIANNIPLYNPNGLIGITGSGPMTAVYFVPSSGLALGAGVGGTATYTLPATGPFTNGVAGPYGLISPGQHQICLMWLTRQGAVSAPGPIGTWIAAGGFMATVSSIVVGPGNVVARLFGMTGAGGDNFFTEPSVPEVNSFVVGTSLLLPDNISTSVVINIADNTLFDSIPIDVIGNDLFDQVVLGPVLGFFSFASRLACWGDYNKVQNFRNMGFCGGYSVPGPQPGTPPAHTNPPWWTVNTAGGQLISAASGPTPWLGGNVWQISDDGSGNPKGQIQQPAFQDTFGNAIISPNTEYFFRCWGSVVTFGGVQGLINVSLFSPSQGVLVKGQIPVSSLTLEGGLVTTSLGVIASGQAIARATPAVIPADTVLRVDTSGSANGTIITLGEFELIFFNNPYRDNLSRWSYVLNPEGFALTTGNLGPEDDESPIRAFALMRQSSLLGTGDGIHVFEDNDQEPGQWKVNQLTRSIGCASLRSMDSGKFGTGDGAEDWQMIAGKNGAYLIAGGEFHKISQEVSRGNLTQAQDPRLTWDDANWAAEQTIVAKNDPATRRAYFALPMNGALTPSKVLMIDYREMDTAAQISSAAPLHITIQGKMKSSDLTRKSSWWNVAANDIEILIRPGNQQQIFFAGGNGQAVGSGVCFGNIYSLDPAKLTDDDYGKIGGANGPYYTTYFFTDHDQEQALGIGSDMKLVKHIHAFIAGVGQVMITPLVNSLYNFQPSLSPRLLVADTDASNFLKSDLEWTNVGLRGQRIAFRVWAQPLPGSTDVQIRLQKFIVGMMRDPVAPFRQSGV
jgi:hypothetical protein